MNENYLSELSTLFSALSPFDRRFDLVPGTWSTFPAPNARSPSSAAATSRRPAWHTARRTSCSSLGVSATCATRYVDMQPHTFLCQDAKPLLPQVIKGDVVNALSKSWCSHHFACSSCDRMLREKSKFYEVDLKPVCKKCYDRFPRELKLRLKQYHEMESEKGNGVQVN